MFFVIFNVFSNVFDVLLRKKSTRFLVQATNSTAKVVTESIIIVFAVLCLRAVQLFLGMGIGLNRKVSRIFEKSVEFQVQVHL